ncbi:type II toxin-antitoxin system ParD family antitoxin [Azospirillum doebereinerae]
MPTMNVSLPAEFVAFVERAVASGHYGSASEVVRDSLRLLRREKSVEDETLAVLRREVGLGVEQARNGDFSPLTMDDILAAARAADEPPL